MRKIPIFSVCLTILFVVPFAYAQETLVVLKPNQLVTFSLAPKQEKIFVLQMKKGDFAEIQSLAREGLNLSFEIYDSARSIFLLRKELLEKSDEGDESFWFVAPKDGEFILVCKFGEYQDSKISGAERISLQYNSKLTLPRGTKLKGVRKVTGFDIKILVTPDSLDGVIGDTILLIEKTSQLQKAMKRGGNGEYMGFSFVNSTYVYSKQEIYFYNTGSVKTNYMIQLTKTTPEIVKRNAKLSESREIYFADELPDLVIRDSSGGRAGDETFFVKLGDIVKVTKATESLYFTDIGRSPKGGLFFEADDALFSWWFTSGCMACASPSSVKVVWEFRNGNLRPNFELMKKPPPSLAILRSKAQKYRTQLSPAPYRGSRDLNSLSDDEDPGLFSKEYLSNKSPVEPFWDVMLDLIFTGNEELAWQFLDLIWSPQKRGRELFIRDFKNELLRNSTWQMILEDTGNSGNKTNNTIQPTPSLK